MPSIKGPPYTATLVVLIVMLLRDMCCCAFIGLALVGKDTVFRFIIEYSSLMDCGPQIKGLFLYEDFWKMIFLACVETWD
jgi:hypothetical protein